MIFTDLKLSFLNSIPRTLNDYFYIGIKKRKIIFPLSIVYWILGFYLDEESCTQMPQVLDGPINDSGCPVERVHFTCVCGDWLELRCCLKGALTQSY